MDCRRLQVSCNSQAKLCMEQGHITINFGGSGGQRLRSHEAEGKKKLIKGRAPFSTPLGRVAFLVSVEL